MPMKIAIVTGGTTGEREVSLKTAHNIQNHIDFGEVITFVFPEEIRSFLAHYKHFDVVIPAIHGLGGEDGSLQGLLEHLSLPYLFSDIHAHAVAIDKQSTKHVAQSLGVPIPQETKTFPLFAKPRCGGSSLASKLCHTDQELAELLQANPEFEFITEQPLQGREFTVGIVQHGLTTILLPVIEIVAKDGFFDFESKYNQDKLAAEICPAQISITLTNELQRLSLLVHNNLKVKHLSRSDFIVTPDNQIYFLEINTIPGMTNTSLVPKMLAAANLSLKDLLKSWCEEVIK